MKKILIVALLAVSTPAMAHGHHHRHHFRHWHGYRHYHHYRYHFRSHYRHYSSRVHVESTAHDLIVARAAAMGISRPVIEHVAAKESGFRCSPPGHYNGPLQILASTARTFGYHGGALNNCGAGLHFGLMHLRMCVNRYGNNPFAVAACHARGF